jgi:hypothetical protein
MEPADIQGAQILLFLYEQDTDTEKNIFRQETVLSDSPWLVSRSVAYLYVDNNATVTLNEKTETVTDSNSRDYTNNGIKSVLHLKKGWNALTTRWEQDGTAEGYHNNFSMSIENPDVYWITYK